MATRRDIMVRIMEAMQEWEDDYDLQLSAQEEYALAERIYNALGLEVGDA